MQLDNTKIEALHKHFQADGAGDDTTLAPILGLKKHETKQIKAYKNAMAAKYPDHYEAPEAEVEETPVTASQLGLSKDFPKGETTYHFVDKGILQPLTVVSTKNGKVVLKLTEPEDKVTVILRGVPQVIDLYQLKKQNSVSPFPDVSVQTLVMLGTLAKSI